MFTSSSINESNFDTPFVFDYYAAIRPQKQLNRSIIYILANSAYNIISLQYPLRTLGLDQLSVQHAGYKGTQTFRHYAFTVVDPHQIPYS